VGHDGPRRPEILLKTDAKTLVLELVRDGKFAVKSTTGKGNTGADNV
jgi:hypothetical protein